MSITIHINKTLQGAAVAGMLLVSSCSSNETRTTPQGTASPVLVQVSKPSPGAGQAIHISGQVEAVQTADISTRVMGYITKINVKVGDRVSRGQLLATISNDDILAKRAQTDAIIAEAEAGLASAQKDYDRFTALYKQQSATAKELDNITLQYSSAKARLEAAKQQRNEVNAMLGYTRLVAPFAGTVTRKTMDAGSMATPGMPILTIEQSGGLQVSAAVPETDIAWVKQGAPVTLQIGAVQKTIQAQITQVDQSSQNTGAQYIVKIAIPDHQKQGLLSGMYADITLPLPQAIRRAAPERIMVPTSAIEYKDDLTGLYTIGSNHTALLRWVRLGKTAGNEVEVISGLAANEPFIVSANGKLYNGVPVTLK